MQIIRTISATGYKYILKPLLFTQNPEKVHDATLQVAHYAGKLAPLRGLTNVIWAYQDSILEQTVNGIHYRNPIGLAAGWDKDAKAIPLMSALGFGFTEVGSITQHAYAGNDGTRLWRLPAQKSILVYYGLKNDGVDVIAPRIKTAHSRIPIGTNIARTNSPQCDDISSIEDYAYSFTKLATIGDYFTINISCPNTFGGQPFHDKKRLDMLLTKLDTIKTKKPVYIKLSPDISYQERVGIAELLHEHRVHGLICGNLTKNHSLPSINDVKVPEQGGFSGKVVEELSDELIYDMYRLTSGTKTIIGLGGVFSGADAYKKITLGASLVQLITGLIYQGPQTVGTVSYELANLLRKQGFTSITQAIGSKHTH